VYNKRKRHPFCLFGGSVGYYARSAAQSVHPAPALEICLSSACLVINPVQLPMRSSTRKRAHALTPVQRARLSDLNNHLPACTHATRVHHALRLLNPRLPCGSRHQGESCGDPAISNNAGLA